MNYLSPNFLRLLTGPVVTPFSLSYQVSKRVDVLSFALSGESDSKGNKKGFSSGFGNWKGMTRECII